jgi:hypothetical protein
MDAWIYRLKAAYDAGYYRTEPAEGAQTLFPWQNKTCKDCPFWGNGICRVFEEYRGPQAHTCTYFDEPNREHARAILQKRELHALQRWWE